MEKSPTVSGEIAVGTLIGIGLSLYKTFESNSWVSRGSEYFVVEGRVKSSECFDGESGVWLPDAAIASSSSIFCWTICSNLSINMSFVSLAWSIWRSSKDSRGIRDRSIAFNALYKVASVSGYGALK